MKGKSSIPCDVIFLVRLQGKFEIAHSWELKSVKHSWGHICPLAWVGVRVWLMVRRELAFMLFVWFSFQRNQWRRDWKAGGVFWCCASGQQLFCTLEVCKEGGGGGGGPWGR